MTKADDIIENPVIGDKVKFLITANDSNGQVLKVRVWNILGAQGPPEQTS